MNTRFLKICRVSGFGIEYKVTAAVNRNKCLRAYSDTNKYSMAPSLCGRRSVTWEGIFTGSVPLHSPLVTALLYSFANYPFPVQSWRLSSKEPWSLPGSWTLPWGLAKLTWAPWFLGRGRNMENNRPWVTPVDSQRLFIRSCSVSLGPLCLLRLWVESILASCVLPAVSFIFFIIF